MPRELAYIAVEGPHDIEFVARLLKPRGFARVRQLPTLDPYWADLVPKTYPPDDDLLKRVPIVFSIGHARSRNPKRHRGF